MSGHSKWSSIKRQKGAADVRRGQTFTKVANAISVAAREGGGGDPAANFKLRLAIEQARAVNMPKENIQRAIDRGLGRGQMGGQMESAVYEAYGPGKAAIVIEAATDNKNRTTSEIKSLIERSGGSFVSPGTVSWMFADQGVIAVARGDKSLDEILDLAVAAGADDVSEAGDMVEIYTKPADLEAVKKALADRGLAITSAEVAKNPTTTVPVTDAEVAKKLLELLEKLENLDDVQKVFSNFDIANELLP